MLKNTNKLEKTVMDNKNGADIEITTLINGNDSKGKFNSNLKKALNIFCKFMELSGLHECFVNYAKNYIIMIITLIFINLHLFIPSFPFL